MPMLTAVLGILALGAVIYAAGIDRTRNAVTTAGSGAKRAATSTTGKTLGGLGVGLQLGAEIINAGMMEPFAVTTAIAGITGALGIAGFLGDITGLQYLLIGFTLFVLVAVFTGDD